MNCIIIQVALFELLKILEITPDVIVGHSFGEIAAAYAQDMLTLEQTMLAAFHTTTVDDGFRLQTFNGKLHFSLRI